MATRDGATAKRRPGGDPAAAAIATADAVAAATARRGGRWSEWFDRQSRTLFVMPAVVMILIFSIFPLIATFILSLSRVRLRGGGYQVRYVGTRNYEKQIFGSEQWHFLGTFEGVSVLGWIVTTAVAGLLAWWLLRYFQGRTGRVSVVGSIGRLITASVLFGLTFMFAATLFSGTQLGTLGVTLFYVVVGCGIQFLIGLGLAFLCSQPIRGRTFFRVVFFLPLMVTPIGIGFTFRMMADTGKGPFAPVWQWFGLGDFAWAVNPWTARAFIIVGDSWQWIPFIFVVMLAALENVPRDLVEAGPRGRGGGLADLPRDHLAAHRAGGGHRDAHPGHRGVQAGGPPEHDDGRRPRHRDRVDDPALVLRLAGARSGAVGGNLVPAALRDGGPLRLLFHARGPKAGRGARMRTMAMSGTPRG